MKMRHPLFTFVWERLTFAAVGVAAALALFLGLAHEVNEGETLRFDAAAQRYFQAQQSPPIHALMAIVSLLASGWAISALSAGCVIALWRKPEWRPRALCLLAAAPGGQGIVYGLKLLFHRARPEAIFNSLGYSFPSGHSFAAVTIYGLLAYWGTREASLARLLWLWSGAIVLILLIGFSRVYLGVHYVSDVLAGFASGLPWLWGCLALTPWREKKQRE